MTQPRETRTSGGRTYPRADHLNLTQCPLQGRLRENSPLAGRGTLAPGQDGVSLSQGRSPAGPGKSAMKTLEEKWLLGLPSPRPAASPALQVLGAETLPG